MSERDYETFELADFTLQRGITLRTPEIAYQTYGRLAADRSNVILYPTSYGAQHPDIEWLIGPERVLDPTDWFIVIPNMFTNGSRPRRANLAPPSGRIVRRSSPTGTTCTPSAGSSPRCSGSRRWPSPTAGRWGAAGAALGGDLPGPGRADLRRLRLGEDLAPQPGVP